jgi:Protein of unknown function (DUF3150)
MTDIRTPIETAIDAQDWRTLMRQGVVVKLTLRRWRGRTKLNYADLGIDVRDETIRTAYGKIMRLGSKFLLPLATIKELDNIDRSARALLERMSFKTTFGQFVPYTSYSAWRGETNRWEAEYYRVRDAIVDDYAGIVFLMIQDYRNAARQAWNLLASTAPDALGRQTSEQFIDTFLERIRRHIPTATEIGNSFRFEINLLRINFPDLVGMDGQEHTINADEAVLKMEQHEQEEHALSEREAMLAAMNLDVVEQARRDKEQIIRSFLGDIAGQLRQLTYDAATDALAVIGHGESLPPQSSRKLRNLLETLERLNFTDDREMQQISSGLQAMIDQPGRDRNMDDVRRQLRAIAVVVRQELFALGDAPRLSRDQEERDAALLGAATEEDVRQARVELFAGEFVTTQEEGARQERMEARKSDVVLSDTLRQAREA